MPQPGGQGGQQGQGQGQGQPQTEFARIASQIGIDPVDFEIDENDFTPVNTIRNVDANGNPTARTTSLSGIGETGKLFINPKGSSIATTGGRQWGIANAHSSAIRNQGTISTQGGSTSPGILTGGNNRIVNQGTITTRGGGGIQSGLFAGSNNPTYILNERGAKIETQGGRNGILGVLRPLQVINRGTIATTGSNNVVGAGVLLQPNTAVRVLNDGMINALDTNDYGVFFDPDVTQAWLGNTSRGTITGDGKGVFFGTGGPGTLINAGTITGTKDDGVEFNGANSTLTNSGTIQTQSTAADVYAVEFSNTATGGKMVLQTGSRILGAMALNDTIITNDAAVDRAQLDGTLRRTVVDGKITNVIGFDANNALILNQQATLDGQASLRNGNDLVNQGTINAPVGSIAVRVIAGGTLTHSGTIQVLDAMNKPNTAATAVQFANGGTLALQGGSTIIGIVAGGSAATGINGADMKGSAFTNID